MADALISVVVEQLAPFLLDKLKKEVKLVLGAPEDVQELHDTFDKIRDVLDDAEKRHVKNVLHNLKKNEIKKAPESAWLEKLKDVSYEMEDVLDEWHTKILKSQIAADESSAPDGARVSKKKISLKELSPLPENYHQRLMMNTSSSTKEALRDCETLLSDAIDQVNTSISRMNDSEAKMYDIRTWVSSAMTDEETCLDGLEETSSSSMPMEEGQGTDNVAITSREEMKRSREWLSDSLAIAANIPN
ncbi:hypothetical protein GIB67_013238 [Kingdonia uniflora]|uniref:Pectinesterase inhibitor domain-containing protein n=1 Tax=Kingdonia uniflora TaxID=39325 RepID=A0A7J7NT38_9MAGN|nr:hypothetical protein GIB67_013238 [Kingdonia uniflora]